VKSKKALDFGCGSGILAIAALKHGAANAVGIDIDPQAITASIENTQTNQIAENQFKAYLPDDAPTQTYDLVMANILKGPLIELCDLICGQINKGGQLILSGLLEAQVSEIVKNYEKHLKIENIETKEGWALVYGIKL
jgi:ribosomal protein L11 methyltransferase